MDGHWLTLYKGQVMIQRYAAGIAQSVAKREQV